MAVVLSPVPWLFFLITFGWSWAFWGPAALAGNGVITLTGSLEALIAEGRPGAWGPLIAAIVVAALHGRGALYDLGSSMVKARFALPLYLAALFLIPAIVGTAQAVAWLAGEEIPASEALANPVSLPIAFIWIFFLGGPLQEEAGWRGTMTRRIQSRWGGLVASLATGVAWGLWHLPLFYMPREEIYYNQPIWGLMISTVLLSVLLGWIYNATGRSLLAAMIMHATWNWSNYVFTTLQTDTGGLAFLILMTIAAVLITALTGLRDLGAQAGGRDR